MNVTFLALLTLGVSASAGLIRRGTSKCCFSLVAEGLDSGPITIGEDNLGDNIIGGTSGLGSYCISTTTSLSDSKDQQCATASASAQFQCMAGLPNTTVFTTADNGNLMADGSPNWWACPATGQSSNGTYDIFADTKSNAAGCIAITLRAVGYSCAALGSNSTIPVSTLPPSTTTVSVPSGSSISNAVPVEPFTLSATTASIPSSTPSSTSPTASCPTDLSSSPYLVPSLIVPVSHSDLDKSFGNGTSVSINPSNITYYSFAMPSTPPYQGTCSLIFTFPLSNEAEQPYTFSGLERESSSHGGLNFQLFGGSIEPGTTARSIHGQFTDYGTIVVAPGDNFTVKNFECAGARTANFAVAAVGDVELAFVQSSLKSPLGVWIVPCT